MSDLEVQRAWREWVCSPTEESETRWLRFVDRSFVSPETSFQDDLRSGDPETGLRGGRLWRALIWELQYSRVSVTCKEEGGLVSCGGVFGPLGVHVRVWYQTKRAAILTGSLQDTRIVVSSSRSLGDVLESLQDSFEGATVVSAGVAREQPDGPCGCGSWQKPKARGEIDKRVLAAVEAVPGSTLAGLANLSPWV